MAWSFLSKSFAAWSYRVRSLVGRAAVQSGRVEHVDCARTNAEAASCSRTNAEAVECSRTNAEAIGFGGVFFMNLRNAEEFREVPLAKGIAGPTLQMRFSGEPNNHGDAFGVPLTIADIESITLTAQIGTPNEVTKRVNWSTVDPVEGYEAVSIDVDESMHDTLQPWSDDYIGYNFEWTVPLALIDEAEVGDIIRLRFVATLASNGRKVYQFASGIVTA